MYWPSRRLLARLQRGTFLYAVSILSMVVVLTAAFPGNEFLTAPWHHDDYGNFSACYRLGWPPLMLLVTRPVSTNLIFLVGAMGESACRLAMLALAAAVPLLGVQLAQRLFTVRPEAWLTVLQVACASVATFVFEHSLQYYRYSGMLTNLTSVVTALVAALLLAEWIDRGRSLLPGLLFAVLTAFAKEDCLGFVFVFTVFYAWTRRRGRPVPAFWNRLMIVGVGLAAVATMLFLWNRYVVPSQFVNGTDPAYRPNFSPAWIGGQLFHYVTVSYVSTAAFVGYAAMLIAAATRKYAREAAIVTIPMLLTLLMPYCVLPRFFEYYSLNWLPLAFAFAIVGLAAIGLEAAEPRRISGWVAAASVLMCTVALLPSRSAHQYRAASAAWLNARQYENKYIVTQILAQRDAFALWKVVAVRGVDGIISPWTRTSGSYLNMKLGRPVRWLLVSRPESFAARSIPRGSDHNQKAIALIFEEDLARLPAVPILQFDRNLNLSITMPAPNQAAMEESPATEARRGASTPHGPGDLGDPGVGTDMSDL